MNERPFLTGMAKRLLNCYENNTASLAPEPFRVANQIYVDALLLDQEKRGIFAKYPLLVCFSTDLPEPGSYYTFDDAGLAILVTRDNAGRAHAFLNACMHRGARLLE